MCEDKVSLPPTPILLNGLNLGYGDSEPEHRGQEMDSLNLGSPYCPKQGRGSLLGPTRPKKQERGKGRTPGLK